ncbi:hypothetical protein [Nostoc sp. PCC 7107]|uniref:hypothetical protein n=1 Tax=Nostoc sp. PCC 7107 TaxID=317936 RepID=UPI00029F1840|nr:hypothetical protein [Nostoc sp. PCC 7107]AFY41200.1 hypothetical protein Nos7107_0527 [Nostoc sp. PCC 7107]
MQLNTKNSISKLIGIWTFIFLLVFKGIFIKPAYAQLTTLDKCATDPECIAAVGAELAPVISAPTGVGFGASTLSTTTSIGSTSAVLRTVAGVAIVGSNAVGGYAIWQHWSQGQNEQAQNKARERYCIANPYDSVCGDIYEVYIKPYWEDEGYEYFWGEFTAVGSIIAKSDCDGACIIYVDSLNNHVFHADPRDKTRILGPKNGIVWANWPQEKRDEAVRLLNPSDWQGFITSMPEGGVLKSWRQD